MFKFIKNHMKATKITAIVILSIAVLGVSALLIVNKMVGNIKPPDETYADANFEYETLAALRNTFAVPEEEADKSASDYTENDAFKMYRRAYSKFLNTDNYYVVTNGFTNAGGIYVNINNQRKFDGKNYYMHTLSLADGGGMFSSASDGSSKHYLYVSDPSGKDNYATVVRLDPYNESVVQKETSYTEKDYVFNFGSIPYAVCDYVISKGTILTASVSVDEATGYYKITFELNPVPATVNMIKKMYALSGTDVSYESGHISYSVLIDSDFVIRRVMVEESYSVKAMGISMSATAGTDDTYYYLGEEGFKGLEENEKYDLTKVPQKEDDKEKQERKEAAAAMESAVNQLLANGVNADMTFALGGNKVLDGRLQLLAKDYTVIELETVIEETPLSVHIQLLSNGSGNIIANVGGIEIGFTFDRLSDAVKAILNKFNVDLGGISVDMVGQIVDNLDVAGIVAGLKFSEGKKENNQFIFNTNLRDISTIPLDIPFDVKVEDNKIVSFKIDDKNVMGAIVGLSLTPSQKAATATLRDLGDDCANITPFLYKGLDFVASLNREGSVANLILSQLSKNDFSINGNFRVGEDNIVINGLKIKNTDKSLDFISAIKQNKVVVGGSVEIGANNGLSLIYTGEEFYLNYNDLFTAKIDNQTINYLFNALKNNFGEIVEGLNITQIEQITQIIGNVKNITAVQIVDMISEFEVSDNEITLGLNLANLGLGLDINQISLRLYKENGNLCVDIAVAEKIRGSVALSNEEIGEIEAPSAGEIIELSGREDLIDGAIALIKGLNDQGSVVSKLVSQISERYFTFNGHITIGQTTVEFQNVLVENQGDLSNPTEAFNNGDIRISGRVKIGQEILDITYVDNTLFVLYNDTVGAKIERLSLDGILQILIDNFDFISKYVDLSDIVSVENGKLKFADISVAQIFGMLGSLSVNNNEIKLNVNGEQFSLGAIALELFINGSGNLDLAMTGNDLALSIGLNNNEFASITRPAADKQGMFINLSNTDFMQAVIDILDTLGEEGTVANKVSKQFEQTNFTFNGNITVGNTVIKLENVKVKNNGSASDPTGSFNAGTLLITGVIKIGALPATEGAEITYTDNIDITYVNSTLFVSYNSALKLKMDKPALDEIVALITKNYREIIERLNYSDALGSIDAVAGLTETTFENLFAMITGLKVSGDAIEITVNGEKLGTGNIVIRAMLDEKGNLVLGGSIGTDGSMEITMNNDELEDIVSPETETNTYMDLSNSKYLIEGLINAILKESNEYYLSGTAGMNFLSIIDFNITMTISIRFVDRESGGKSVEVVMALANMDYGFGGSLVQNYVKYGKSMMIFKDNNVYIEREDYKYSAGLFGIGSSFKSQGVEYRKMTMAYFGNDILNQIGYFVGFTESLIKMFPTNINIAIEKFIKGYTGSETNQAITLDGAQIDKMLGDITADFTLENVNDKKQMTQLDATLTIDFGVKLKVDMHFDHVLDAKGDFTEIGNIETKYAGVELLELTPVQ